MNRFLILAAVTAVACFAGEREAAAQTRRFDCTESSIAGRFVTVTVTGPRSVRAGRIAGRDHDLVQSGPDPFRFSARVVALTVSKDQGRVEIRTAKDAVVCYYDAAAPAPQPGESASSCPPGTKPVPETDNCVPDRKTATPRAAAVETSCPPGTRPVPETDDCVPERVAAGPGDGLIGRWVQIASNAGDCPNCTITISRSGNRLKVVGSNGWTATLIAGQDGDPDYASGEGRWSRGAGAFAGRPFSLDLQLRKRRLRMTMGIRGGGGDMVVEAGFAPL